MRAPLVARKGQWAYQTFRRSLGGVVIRNEWISADHTGFYVGRRVSQVIQRGIEDLINSAAGEGWEPAEEADIESLFRQGQIDLDYHDYFILSSVRLESVRIRFKRWAEDGSHPAAYREVS